jgi:hypothetical protein
MRFEVLSSPGSVTNWNGSFTTAGTTYSFTMVGTDPALGSQTSIIPTVIIPLIFKFSDGSVLDPTLPACGVTNSALTSVVNSPIFQSSSYLVFLPWFAKASAPTQSVNGWYTFLNSYSAPSATCR